MNFRLPIAPLAAARSAGLAMVLCGLSTGCEQIQALVDPKPAQAEPAKAEAAHAAGDTRAKTDEHAAAPSPSAGQAESDEYALPFAWETSKAEPLGQARNFLRDVYTANGNYARTFAKVLPTFAEKETPRATVVTCADSRMQAGAFDESAENDDFTVRDIGNQVVTALGSVGYGVEQLNTPVLLILGHTGCTAVKAAMDGTDDLSGPLQKELATIHAPKHDARKSDSEMWVRGVVENVRDQVAFSLQKFGRRVHAGKLTVIGAVVDLRNDMGFGVGRLVIVDVNGTHDEKRIAAFNEAVVARASSDAGDSDSHGEPSASLPESPSEPTTAPEHGPRPEHNSRRTAPAATIEPADHAANTSDRLRRGGHDAEVRKDEKAILQALASLPSVRTSHTE